MTGHEKGQSVDTTMLLEKSGSEDLPHVRTDPEVEDLMWLSSQLLLGSVDTLLHCHVLRNERQVCSGLDPIRATQQVHPLL